MPEIWQRPTFFSLPDQVAKAILSQIVSGQIKPGDTMPSQRQLSISMNVAFSVVREAFQRLEALGVVKPHRGIGTVVQRFNWVKIFGDEALLHKTFDEFAGTELWETRHAIEREIARLAAVRRSESSLSIIRDVLDSADPVPLNYQDNMSLNRDFHMAVAEAADNQVLRDFVAPLLSLPLRGIAEKFTEERSKQVWKAHRRIYDAIASGSVAAAEAAIDEHLRVGPIRSEKKSKS